MRPASRKAAFFTQYKKTFRNLKKFFKPLKPIRSRPFKCRGGSIENLPVFPQPAAPEYLRIINAALKKGLICAKKNQNIMENRMGIFI